MITIKPVSKTQMKFKNYNYVHNGYIWKYFIPLRNAKVLINIDFDIKKFVSFQAL